MQDDEPPALCLDEPGLAACYAAAAQGIALTGERAGQPTLRVIVSQNPRANAPAARNDGEPVAEVCGINVHAKRVVDASCRPRGTGRGDRPQIERLLQVRHPTSPRSGSPPAPQRWPARADAQKHLAQRSTRCGSPSHGCSPRDDLRTSRPTRASRGGCAPPNFHWLRYFGVLSGHSALRSKVVPEPRGRSAPAPAATRRWRSARALAE